MSKDAADWLLEGAMFAITYVKKYSYFLILTYVTQCRQILWTSLDYTVVSQLYDYFQNSIGQKTSHS